MLRVEIWEMSWTLGLYWLDGAYEPGLETYTCACVRIYVSMDVYKLTGAIV